MCSPLLATEELIMVFLEKKNMMISYSIILPATNE